MKVATFETQDTINDREHRRGTKGQSNMKNSEKLAIFGTQDKEKKTQYNMCWTPLYTNKHK